MKRLILLLALLLAFQGIATAIPNPSAVYCSELGYEYKDGDCIFPDGSRCDAWQYYCKCEPNGIGCWPGDFNCAYPCGGLPCKEEGEFILISQCCEGLTRLPRIEAYDDQCNLIGWIGWAFLCSDCGNGICESWESICNCLEDCARIHNITQNTYYETIQDAIDDAFDGDTVLVADGTYTGPGNRDIDFKGKAITVRSESGPENCIIDCKSTDDKTHRGFYLHNGEEADSILEGFTITNGDSYGGAIYCEDSNPEINNCIITGNMGPGIYCLDGSPTINNCIISDNSAKFYAGGIYCHSFSSPTITNCTISGNTMGGIGCWDSSPTISNCTIIGNTASGGGGIYCSDSSPVITKCTISGNTASGGGGIFFRYGSPAVINCTISSNSAEWAGGIFCGRSSPDITNCILWDNEATDGPQIYLSDISSALVSYTDVQGDQNDVYISPDSTLNWGLGNIDADPCFVQPGYWVDANDPNIIVEPDDPNAVWVDGDYHLLPDSPCIDAGDPNYVAEPNETDLDGNPRVRGDAIDMGAYETIIHEVRLLVVPRVINRKSSKPRIMAWVRLLQGITKDQVDRDEPLILYPGGIKAIRQFIIPNRRRGAQRASIFAVFDKAELMDAIPANGRVELQVLGHLRRPGQYFYGSDTIRIIPRRLLRPTSLNKSFTSVKKSVQSAKLVPKVSAVK